MADTTVTANAGSGGASFVVDNDGSGNPWPYAKLAFGGSGTQTRVSAANPLPVSTQPWLGTALGYQQLTSLNTASTLTIPSGATFFLATAEGASLRWRDDGTSPSVVVGMPLLVGSSLSYSAALSAISFIQQASGGILNVSYYK